MCCCRSFHQLYGIRYYDCLSANYRLLRAASKRHIHKTFTSSISHPLPLLVEMPHCSYRPLAKINIGPHKAVVKSATLLEEFEFLYSPFAYVIFFSLYVFISTVTSISLTKEEYCELGAFCIYDNVECIRGNQGTFYL